MNRLFSRFMNCSPKTFRGIALCLCLWLAMPCLAWAAGGNAANFRDMSNNIDGGYRLPPSIITQALLLMAAGGLLVLFVFLAYWRRSLRNPDMRRGRYVAAAVLPFYIIPAGFVFIAGLWEGFSIYAFTALFAAVGIVTACLAPLWLACAFFYRRLMKKPEAERARPARYGLAALVLFIILAASLPFAEYAMQRAALQVWLLGAGAFFLLLLLAFRTNAGWQRGGAAALAVVALAAAVVWWNRDPFEAADAAHAQRDYAKAIEIIRPLAEKSDVRAAYKLGVYYSDWDNPQASQIVGLKWLTYAAGKGHAEAAWLLALAYLWGSNGRVTPDGEKGAHWLVKAAELGQPDAQSTLGDYYKSGAGGFPQDMQKAAELLERAARQGEWNASESLYWLYRKGGPGMEPDFEKAYFWYMRWRDNRMTFACPDTVDRSSGQAAPADNDLSRADCEDTQLIPLMTAAQIAAAKKRYQDEPKPPEYNPFIER